MFEYSWTVTYFDLSIAAESFDSVGRLIGNGGILVDIWGMFCRRLVYVSGWNSAALKLQSLEFRDSRVSENRA